MPITNRITKLQAEPLDFAPAILRTQHQPPSPLPRLVLHGLLALFALMLLWAALGRLDIIAVAPGKLVPVSYLKVVQPAESGIVKEILVQEGDAVRQGQALVRMDPQISEADNRQLQEELRSKSLQVRRIDAELTGTPLKKLSDDPPQLFIQVEAQYRARRQAYQDALDAERALLAKARSDLKSALEVQAKLEQTLPIYQAQEAGWNQLAREGYAGKLLAMDRSRSRIEAAQDLKAQQATVASLKASISQSEKRLAQIGSNYRQQLHNERVEAEGQYHKLQQDWDKQSYRHRLLELKAPQDGVIKDLATHTTGSVVSPGTILMTLVPHNDPLQAEVWVSNLDAGFVRPRQPVKLKLAAYPFQRYGMLDGDVKHISPDASELPKANDDQGSPEAGEGAATPSGYRALVALKSPFLEVDEQRHPLVPGMQVAAEIHLGTRTVLEYLLSPVKKVAYEAARER